MCSAFTKSPLQPTPQRAQAHALLRRVGGGGAETGQRTAGYKTTSHAPMPVRQVVIQSDSAEQGTCTVLSFRDFLLNMLRAKVQMPNASFGLPQSAGAARC